MTLLQGPHTHFPGGQGGMVVSLASCPATHALDARWTRPVPPPSVHGWPSWPPHGIMHAILPAVLLFVAAPATVQCITLSVHQEKHLFLPVIVSLTLLYVKI